MSYLSKIAARGAPGNMPSLMPAMPLMTRSTADSFQQDIDAQSTFDPIAPANVPADQQHEPGKTVKPIIQEGTYTNPRERHFEKTYITKHIERLTPADDNTHPADVSAKSISTNYIAPDADTLPRESIANEHAEQNAIGNKEPVRTQIKPHTEPLNNSFDINEKNKLIGIKPIDHDQNQINLQGKVPIKSLHVMKPSQEIRKLRDTETATIASKVAKLNPPQPNSVAPAAKGNKEAPKLVIGKISVEILPPVAPQPAKVITRVVQAPSYSESSKTNKLSFGLGQL